MKVVRGVTPRADHPQTRSPRFPVRRTRSTTWPVFLMNADTVPAPRNSSTTNQSPWCRQWVFSLLYLSLSKRFLINHRYGLNFILPVRKDTDLDVLIIVPNLRNDSLIYFKVELLELRKQVYENVTLAYYIVLT